jgi:hypothetical protein
VGGTRNVVRGESHYRAALRRLTGNPRRAGYLIPVEVTFIREPTDQYDRNAFRVEVAGEHVGYLAREIAATIAKQADKARCSNFSVCGVLRGGSIEARDVGVHAWLGRRRSPGLKIEVVDEGGIVEWPPSGREGVYCSADED